MIYFGYPLMGHFYVAPKSRGQRYLLQRTYTEVNIDSRAGVSQFSYMAPNVAPFPAPKSHIAMNICDTRVVLPEAFSVVVLGDREHLVQARALKLIGRRLIAQVSEYLNAEDCVQIGCEDAFLLGEVLGSWREGDATFVAIELQQALTRLSQLAEWVGEHISPMEARQSA